MYLKVGNQLSGYNGFLALLVVAVFTGTAQRKSMGINLVEKGRSGGKRSKSGSAFAAFLMASALAATSLTPIAEAFSVTSCITCSEHSSMLNSAVQLCHVSAHDSPIGTFPFFDKKSRNPYPCDFRVLKAMEFERRHVGHYQHLPPNLNA